MLTPAEHLEEYARTKKFPPLLWLHALDVLKHCLQGDEKQTFWKDGSPCHSELSALTRKLDGMPKERDSFLEAKENTEKTERKWRRIDSEFGELVVERYLDGDERPFDDYRKEGVKQPAVTLIIDMSANSSDRSGTQMAERHKQVYDYACRANRDCRPCRVVAVTSIGNIPELSRQREKVALVLKDYDDPIFPAIWAAFETNASTNDFLNVFQDFFIGTRAWGNGCCMNYNIFDDFQDSEVILVEPHTYVTYEPPTTGGDDDED